MLTDRVTLFGRHSGDVLTLEGGFEVLVHCHRKNKWAAGEAIEDTLRDYGGVAVFTEATGQLRFVAFGSGAYKPPAQALLLSPGGDATFLGLRDLNARGLASGQHVLLPVDSEAEEKLRQFNDLLEWLPGDRALLIRHLIRGPGLDWRLTELEHRVERALRDSRSPRTSWVRLPESAAWRWALSAGVAILVVLGIATYFHFPDWHFGAAPSPPSGSAAGGPDVGVETGSGTTPAGDASDPPIAQNGEIDKAVDELLNELRRLSGSVFRQFKATHLPELENVERNELLKDQRFAWAMIKLEVWRQTDTAVLVELVELGNPSSSEAVKASTDKAREVFGLDSNTRLFKLPAPQANMLAYVSCAAWNKSALPSPASTPELRFLDAACDKVDHAQAAEGVRLLIQRLGMVGRPASSPRD